MAVKTMSSAQFDTMLRAPRSFDYVSTTHLGADSKLLVTGQSGKRIIVLGYAVEPGSNTGIISFRSGADDTTTDTLLSYEVSNFEPARSYSDCGVFMTEEGENLYIHKTDADTVTTAVKFVIV